MYVLLEEAKRIVWRRWRDTALRQEVKDYAGEIPEFLRHEPRAVLARHVATPNFEFTRFDETAKKAGLTAYCCGYVGDKFCTKNPDKLLLGKMTFSHGKGGKSGDSITCCKVMNFNRGDGKPFTDVRTLWEEGLVDFHHRLLAAELPDIVIADITEWINKRGGKPALFWPRLLALFVCHGILFDNFHTEGHEEEFTKEIIQPALEKVKKRFGLKPLVVPMVPLEEEREPYWSWYPEHLEQALRAESEQQVRAAIVCRHR